MGMKPSWRCPRCAIPAVKETEASTVRLVCPSCKQTVTFKWLDDDIDAPIPGQMTVEEMLNERRRAG